MMKRFAHHRLAGLTALKMLLSALIVCAGMVFLPSTGMALPQLLVDLDRNIILAAEDQDHSWHPASLTKLMTAYVAFEALRAGDIDLDTPVVMTAHSASQPPSKLGLPVGHGLTMKDALAVMLTRSMNDVATAVAETVGGDETTFVRQMNAAAEALGMNSTHFTNANGLHDPQQVTTARDIALLSTAILNRHGMYSAFFSSPEVSVAGRVMRNTNGLIRTYEGARGLKTGYVCAAGFNLATVAERDGRRLLSIVLGAGSGREREAMNARLLDLGFSHRTSNGIPLQPGGRAIEPALDMHAYGCGRSYPSALKRTPPLLAPYLPSAENLPLPLFRADVPALAYSYGGAILNERLPQRDPRQASRF